MEPRQPTDTAAERKGQVWKVCVYFLVLYVVTYAANQIIIGYKDMA
jgi:hypothetical protein